MKLEMCYKQLVHKNVTSNYGIMQCWDFDLTHACCMLGPVDCNI